MPRATNFKSFKLYFSESLKCYGIWRYKGVYISRMEKEQDPLTAKETNIVFYFKTQFRNSKDIKRVIEKAKEHLGCNYIVAAPGKTPERNALQQLFGDEVIKRTVEVPARKFSHGKDISPEWLDSIKINWSRFNKNTKILLIDDFLITGRSIQALTKLLSAKGHTVIPLVLGFNPKLFDLTQYEDIDSVPPEEPKFSIVHPMPVRELEAFELYYALGEDRSINRLVTSYPDKKYNRATVTKWSLRFNWPKLIKERDSAIVQVVEETAVRTVIEEKIEALYKTDRYLEMIAKVIETAFSVDKSTGVITTKIEINSVADLKKATDSFEKLIKLKLQLFGEDLDRDEGKIINLQIVQNSQTVEERKIEIRPVDAEYSEEEE